MKLYISYYGNYVSIIEGTYNKKKDKYNIKKSIIVSEDDVEVDYRDKYSLLKQALALVGSKIKNVVLCLNTKDIIIKSNRIPMVDLKDLDGIMNNEMYEMMSLDYDQYTFSYEVVKENILEDKEELEVIIAAILNEELDIILDIFKNFKLNLVQIDTISTAYSRLLKKIEYKDIMMLNIGGYGSIVNIYKEDSLFIYDNIPVRINNNINDFTCLALIDEINGLMNFYSSRNFGKSLENIVLLGQSHDNSNIIKSFKESFTSDIVTGIENLFDIKDDIQGDLEDNEISKMSELLGCMSINHNEKYYSYMNLLPEKLKNKYKIYNKIKQYVFAIPIALCIILSPYVIFGIINNKVNNEINTAKSKLDLIEEQYQGISDINDRIEKIREEIEIYDMLSSKEVFWGNVLTSIDVNIPYSVDLTSIEAKYDESYIDNENENLDKIETNENKEVTEQQENPIYNQIPNIIIIDGIAKNTEYVGQFIYNLNKLSYFKSVKLKNSSEDKENSGYTFNIVLELNEGAVSSE